MRKSFLFLSVLVMSAAADLPTVGYVSEYFELMCHNPDLVVPGSGNNNLVDRRWLLSIVDDLNVNTTTYAVGANLANIVSTGFLKDTLSMLSESSVCCPGGFYDLLSSSCQSCGEWLRGDGTNIICPGTYDEVLLENIVLTDVGEMCPTGMTTYYEIDSVCTQHIN